MAESFNGLYKWKLIYKQGPWRGLDDVEVATMTYVDWFNHRRLHGEITDDATYTTPVEPRPALVEPVTTPPSDALLAMGRPYPSCVQRLFRTHRSGC